MVDADLENIAGQIAIEYAGGHYEIASVLRTLGVYEDDFETIEDKKYNKDGRFGTGLVNKEKIKEI